MFLSFQAIISGFLSGCRPFIGLDGCHLKETYGGVLIVAIGIDGNNGVIPLAIGIAKVECGSSWNFFMSFL